MSKFICKECLLKIGDINGLVFMAKCKCDDCGEVKQCTEIKDTSVQISPFTSEVVSTNQSVSQIQNFDIETAIGQAIQKGVPIEIMKELLAMRKELKDESAKEQFFISLAKFQSECPTIKKSTDVKFNTTNYSYAPIEKIVEQVKVHLTNNGFSYSLKTVQTETTLTVMCEVHHTAGHTEATEIVVPIVINDKTSMSAIQRIGSSMTYAKRYSFCNAFGIMTGDTDNDGRIIDGKKPVAKTPPAKTPPPKKEKTLLETYGGNLVKICAGKYKADDKSDEAKAYRKEAHAHFCDLTGMCDYTENAETKKRTVIAPELNKLSDKLLTKLIEVTNIDIKKEA